jgi:two-component system response regulator AlgR
MTRIRVVIVDDSPTVRDHLGSLLRRDPGFEVVGEAGDGHRALRQAAALAPDLVLLDVRMPGMNGLEVAFHLATLERAPAVVFATAFEEFAVDAFDARAVGYLLKPVRAERLASALARAKPLDHAAVGALARQGGAEARRNVCARVRGELRLIPVDEVVYFRADLKYVTVRHQHGEVLIEESLKALEDEFGVRFVRVHRNALVAVAAIEALERDAEGHARVRLRGIAETLEVSRREVATVKDRLRDA